jgi:mycofactocin system glycosyltransferase
MTRYVLDASTHRPDGDGVVIGGSPLRLFRLTAAGATQYGRLAAGEDVGPSRLVDRLLDAGAIHPRPDTGPFTAADITVVVPALAVPAEALARLREACLGVASVLVVDDGSQPPIEPVDGVRLLRLRSNTGPAVARNAGLAAVTTPLVAFVDTDVDLRPGWWLPLLGHFADERVALVAPRVAATPGRGRRARYEAAHSPLDLGAEPARIAPGTRVSYVPAAALVARTAAMRAIDGFDRRLRVGEDVDAVWRLVEAGWRCRYEPAAVVHHRPRPTWRSAFRQRVGYGSSAALLARRHPGAIAPVRISGWSAAAWTLVLAGRPRPAIAVAAGTAVALVPKLRGVPAAESLRLAATGHLLAGRQLADAARRVWWPVLLLGSLMSARVRRITGLAALPALVDGGPLRLLDDLSYGVGVWRGMLVDRTWAPLVPDLRSWPPRAFRRAGGGPHVDGPVRPGAPATGGPARQAAT